MVGYLDWYEYVQSLPEEYQEKIGKGLRRKATKIIERRVTKYKEFVQKATKRGLIFSSAEIPPNLSYLLELGLNYVPPTVVNRTEIKAELNTMLSEYLVKWVNCTDCFPHLRYRDADEVMVQGVHRVMMEMILVAVGRPEEGLYLKCSKIGTPSWRRLRIVRWKILPNRKKQ